MANELRKTFPRASNDDIKGGKVYRSTCVSGFTIITWEGYLPKGNYPGWIQTRDSSIEYSW
ncbi:hypothetical protein H6784_03740 [Candidatus Nomurabacteria bacterium]|nr:hypothetical protein [Candidatus Nomurabacteria bacterium]